MCVKPEFSPNRKWEGSASYQTLANSFGNKLIAGRKYTSPSPDLTPADKQFVGYAPDFTRIRYELDFSAGAGACKKQSAAPTVCCRSCTGIDSTTCTTGGITFAGGPCEIAAAAVVAAAHDTLPVTLSPRDILAFSEVDIGCGGLVTGDTSKDGPIPPDDANNTRPFNARWFADVFHHFYRPAYYQGLRYFRFRVQTPGNFTFEACSSLTNAQLLVHKMVDANKSQIDIVRVRASLPTFHLSRLS